MFFASVNSQSINKFFIFNSRHLNYFFTNSLQFSERTGTSLINSFIFFYGLIFNNLIILNHQSLKKFENYFFPKSKMLCAIIIFLVCFSWNPKAVYHEDLGSIPIYRTFEKIDNFIINFKW
jgi:hypothetical protein